MRKILLTRSTGKITDIIPIAILLSFVMMVLGDLVSSVFLAVYFRAVHITAADLDNAAMFLLRYLSFGGIWIVFILFAVIFKNNRPMLRTLAFRKDGVNLRGAVIGLLLGVCANGLCVLISCLNGDIVLHYNGFEPGPFFLFFLAITIQSGAEELIDRCYVYQKLRRGYKQAWIAIVANAVIFALMHILNPGVTAVAISQIVIVGILFSLFVYYYGSLWAAIMMHMGWNFTQSIICGLPNSGIVSEYSLFKLDAASARDGLFYSVNFGVEGSIGAVVVLAILCVIVFALRHKAGEKEDIWKEMEMELAKKEAQKGGVEA